MVQIIPIQALEEKDGQGIQERINEKIQNLDTPYNSIHEPLPNIPAYHPSFARLENHYEILLEAAIRTLESSTYHDDVTDRLSKECRNWRKVQYPHAPVVGLVGDSGVGKSSLINAILDTPDLALAGATGAACTCVITEYREAWASQTSTFRAEIVLLDRSKIASLLEGYLHDYSSETIQSNEDIEPDTLEEIRSRSDTALEVFLTLFATRSEFKDKYEAVKFLATATTAQGEEILSQLLEWLDSTITACGAVDGTIIVCEEDAKSLSQGLKPFVKIGVNLGSNATPSLWPIVTVVRIGLRAPLLKRGVIIADLPGLSDVNRTRTHITNAYIHSCDHIFLVAPIARVQTDKLVDQRIAEYITRFGPRVSLICTKSDDVAAIVDPEDFSATNHAISEYTHLLRIYEEMGSARTDLLSRKKAAVGKAKAGLGLDLNNLTLRESVLKMRNRKVERAMRDRHQEADSVNGPLRIVCVSSMAYEVNALGYSEDVIPVSVESTGIPQLRSVISGLPARERLSVLQLYCWGHLKSLISSMESWTVQSTIARRLELREVVAKPRKLAESVINTLCQEIQSHLEKTIVATIPMGDVVVIPSEPFMKSLAPKKMQLSAAFGIFTTKLRKSTSAIRLHVITDDTDGSYLMEAMVPIYRSCVEESGKGSHPRRVARLHSAIKHGEPFVTMEPGVRSSIKSELDIRYGKLVKKVNTVFDVVLADFDSMFVVEERPDVARNMLRSEIRDFVKKAHDTMNGTMETELARAINESSG
ncbi:MAG: hypothetical protein Q9212_001298 [Teloschistes hypoglaucus]